MSTQEDPLGSIDPDLADLIPGYIENRVRDVALCREHLAAGRFEPIRILAHGMAGSGGSYGLPEVTRIGRTLEVAARAGDTPACGRAIDELGAHVRRLVAAYDARRSNTGRFDA